MAEGIDIRRELVMNPGIEVIILLLGILSSVSGICILISEISIRINGMRTKATVVNIIREHNHNNDDRMSPWVYYPVFEYRVNGQIYTVRFKYGSSSEYSYVIGQNVEIIYHRKRPEKITCKKNYMILIAGIIFIFMGIVVLLRYFGFIS